MKALLLRLSEPSTYAGLAGLAVVLGMTAEEYMTYAAALAGVFSTIAVILGEKSQ